MRKQVVILGIPVDDLNFAETLDHMEQLVIAGRTGKTGCQVVTVNADFLVKAMSDPELRAILRAAHLATADGMPLIWGARLLGVPLKGRVAGSDFVPELAQRAAQKGFSIFLLGAAPQVAAKAAENLRLSNPALKVVGVISPQISSIADTDASIIDAIKSSRPDILLVALGNPKQEKWISMYAPQLQVPLTIGIGGTLDLIAGNMRRAPVWMQRAGLEWLFRLLQEPRRLFRRYAIDLVLFTVYFARQWIAMRLLRAQSNLASVVGLSAHIGVASISIQGSLTITNLGEFQNASGRALSQASFIIVDLARAGFLDCAAIGALVGLARQTREAGGDLTLVDVPPGIRRTLSLLKLEEFFTYFDNSDQQVLNRENSALPA